VYRRCTVTCTVTLTPHRSYLCSLPVGAAADGNGNTVNALGASAANIAPRFSFQLEKRHLSTIHLNSIARIYGDHGELSVCSLYCEFNFSGSCSYVIATTQCK
jgi:hypothetical protein